MRIVIALGGNALGNTYLEQQELIKNASRKLVNLFKDNEVIICHGNGPQVGMIVKALANDGVDMPLDCCTAMSEGYIGFHLQREIRETLKDFNINREIVTIVTDVLVDKSDKSFDNPTKPIGKFYTEEEAKKLMSESGDIYAEDSNRGYRKVVASPRPIGISGLKAIETLIKDGTIVIACGGGGIPIIADDDSTKVDAVIDKDLAASLLALKLKADKLIILTAVPQVMINFGKENEMSLDELSIEKAKKYIENDEFKKGSMLPKIEAAMEFVSNTGKDAIITSLSNIDGIINNKDITVIHK